MHDAEVRFPRADGVAASESEICIAGDVLVGRAKPQDCPAFGTLCTPESPLGAPMVSSEGACAAYFVAGRHREEVRA
jgi:hydrogenase expression/formation protein HypD